jgi:hypothetical protein
MSRSPNHFIDQGLNADILLKKLGLASINRPRVPHVGIIFSFSPLYQAGVSVKAALLLRWCILGDFCV